jgi:hypothetical protein
VARRGVEGFKTPVVQHQEIGAPERAQQARMATVAARQGEFLEQPGDPLINDGPIIPASLMAKR